MFPGPPVHPRSTCHDPDLLGRLGTDTALNPAEGAFVFLTHKNKQTKNIIRNIFIFSTYYMPGATLNILFAPFHLTLSDTLLSVRLLIFTDKESEVERA